MIVALFSDEVPTGRSTGGWLRELTDDGIPAGPARWVCDLPGAVRASSSAQRGRGLRWLWPSSRDHYAQLARSGVRLARCHDVELSEALLLASAGRWGEPRSLAAAFARVRGAPVPPDPQPRQQRPTDRAQRGLFELPPAGSAPAAGQGPAQHGIAGLDALVRVYADQRARCAAAAEPGRLRMLLAAESAAGLAAVEMGLDGLPFRTDIHETVLRELLGAPSRVGGPPRRLAELTERIVEAFEGQRPNPDSPAELLRAFSKVGIALPSTRAQVLRQVDHPVVPLLLEYKELYRVWTAHGWTWRQQWVRDGRCHPEYVAGGVPSGRWATRGGGALQIPKPIRRAVVADPGWVLVVADAGQLEPRVLAAVSADEGLIRAAAAGDLYAALAGESFGSDRAAAKLA
ncbi:MAG: bifunctional 3'-5' exonuclease/DNA polymerase, partial [Dactylosporangium sp.]|nr:bifunctional 3'-5' exonuclease/DNA polymerase [Dactylosporangium sp.]NNJ62212.1 bifunctional 3'-5' exonuclease/DNA polymerase [Dactylosporangium sp.]